MASLLPDLHDQHSAQEEDIDDLVPSSPKAPIDATPSYKLAFLRSCLSASVLTFGSFTLKSGRQSPYFFNCGLFYTGSLIDSISTAYSETLIHYSTLNPSFDFDVLFGPAYKGIPLAAFTVPRLAQLDKRRYADLGYSFNRKEKKDHGDGGDIVGAPLRGKKVVIIDDVITAGTAVTEAINIIVQQGGMLVGIVIALDRMERMSDDSPGSAIGELRKVYGVPVLSIIDLNDLVQTLEGVVSEQDMLRLEEYKRRYGASD